MALLLPKVHLKRPLETAKPAPKSHSPARNTVAKANGGAQAGVTNDLAALAKTVGGGVSKGWIRIAGPGHSPKDNSLAFMPDSSARDGFRVKSFAGDDPEKCRNYIRSKIGTLRREGEKTYVYETADGKPFLQVIRTKGKKFFQRKWDGARWVNGKPSGRKIPYRLPELVSATKDTAVFVVEGEKDADRLTKEGSPNGIISLGFIKPRENCTSPFRHSSKKQWVDGIFWAKSQFISACS
jgi:hypothetical protein